GNAGREDARHVVVIAARNRASPLKTGNHRSAPVGGHLNLHMAGPFDVLFQKKSPVAEIGLRPSLGRWEDADQLFPGAADLHADSAPATTRLQHQRIADRL